MKKRLLISALLQLVLTAFSLLGAYNLDRLAGGRGRGLSLGFEDALAALANRRVLLLFLLLTGLSAVGVGFMALGSSYINYRSDMLRVTPDLETPMAAGQGQYGTAHWLEKRRIPEVFTVVRVDRESPLLRELAARGAEDLEERDAPP